MKNFERIAHDIDVKTALKQIEAYPELWDQHGARTGEGSPHHGVSDIWVRWRSLKELDAPQRYAEPHFAVFYPAWALLPALKPIVFGVAKIIEPVYLGGILITKIPPGGKVLPHDDRGGWHAHFMNKKVYIPLKSNPRCINRCEDEEISMRAGECYGFNNLLTHSVENDGDEERITLIICFRVE